MSSREPVRPPGEPSPGASATGRPAARLVVRVTSADVGGRVSLRYRHDPVTLTDVVGRLLSWEAGVLRVERRDGRVQEVAEADLVAGRRVPDAPATRRGR